MEYYDIHEYCISYLISSSFVDKKFKKRENFILKNLISKQKIEIKMREKNNKKKLLRILLKLTLKGI